MPVITSQKIKDYYEKYGRIDVTFNKEINNALGLVQKQVFLKYRDGQLHCIIYSSSLTGAKVVIPMTSQFSTFLETDGPVSLRFCFYNDDRTDTFSFFVQCRVREKITYDQQRDLYLLHLTFTQRPPDDLIGILGELLDVNINASRRNGERIVINPDNMRHLGLADRNATVKIDGIPRNGILRDLSFGGVKIIIMGNARFLIRKDAELVLSLKSGSRLKMHGTIIRYEPVEGRKDLAALIIQFDSEHTSYEYKTMINDYLTNYRRIASETGTTT